MNTKIVIIFSLSCHTAPTPSGSVHTSITPPTNAHLPHSHTETRPCSSTCSVLSPVLGTWCALNTWAWTCWPPEEWVCVSGHCQGQPRIWVSHLAFSQPRVAPVTAAAALGVTLGCCRSPRLRPTLMSPQSRCLHRPVQLQWCCEALCCS